MIAFLFAAMAAPAADAAMPQAGVCLLAGPSRSLVAVQLQLVDGQYSLRKISKQAWPFAIDQIVLNPPSRDRRDFEGSDPAAGLYVSLTTAFIAQGGTGLNVRRGSTRLRALPVLSGSCVRTGSAAANRYLRQGRDKASAMRLSREGLQASKLSSSRDCQVVSADGWVSRFSIDHQDGITTIRPADNHMWKVASLESQRAGMTGTRDPYNWLRSYFLYAHTSPNGTRRSTNSISVYSTPDDTQSSSHISFYGREGDHVLAEDLTGICARFVDEGRASG